MEADGWEENGTRDFGECVKLRGREVLRYWRRRGKSGGGAEVGKLRELHLEQTWGSGLRGASVWTQRSKDPACRPCTQMAGLARQKCDWEGALHKREPVRPGGYWVVGPARNVHEVHPAGPRVDSDESQGSLKPMTQTLLQGPL